MNYNTSHFYHKKPIFGLDLGYNSAKVMQISKHGEKLNVVGYGAVPFNPASINDKGVIIDHEDVAKAVHTLFSTKLVGDINTNRVCLAVPAGRTYARNFKLPNLSKKEVENAIKLETEQYVPISIEELYYDATKISQNTTEQELLAVATPKRIVDSYIELAAILGLDIAAIEVTTASEGRLFKMADQSDVPSVLIDLGSITADITIFDKNLIVTGNVPGGGDTFTSVIAKKLDISIDEAHIVKTKYGLGMSKKQKEITESLEPMLTDMIKEIKRMIRYYEERSGTNQQISQIVTMGGGANMPGLSEYMTNSLRLPVRLCDPWHQLKFDGIYPPNPAEKSMYVTVAGLALVTHEELET